MDFPGLSAFEPEPPPPPPNPNPARWPGTMFRRPQESGWYIIRLDDDSRVPRPVNMGDGCTRDQFVNMDCIFMGRELQSRCGYLERPDNMGTMYTDADWPLYYISCEETTNEA